MPALPRRTSSALLPAGKRLEIDSWISYSPYRNPEDWSLHHRPASSWDFVSAPLFLALRPLLGKRTGVEHAGTILGNSLGAPLFPGWVTQVIGPPAFQVLPTRSEFGESSRGDRDF